MQPPPEGQEGPREGVMNTTLRVLAGISLIVAAAGPLAGGYGGSGGGSPPAVWRFTYYYRGLLPGDSRWTLTTTVESTQTPERAFWRSGDPSGDWVHFLADPARAGFLVRGGAHTTRPDWDAFAVFGVRDDEVISLPDFGTGSSFADDRARIWSPIPAVRRRSRASPARPPLETWFGDIDRAMIGDYGKQAAFAVRQFGVRRSGAVSTVSQAGLRQWTYAWTLSNFTAGDLDFSWPSVLTDGEQPWEGSLAPGETAVLTRTLGRPPSVYAGPVKFTRPGQVHPDFQAAAEAYTPRP